MHDARSESGIRRQRMQRMFDTAIGGQPRIGRRAEAQDKTPCGRADAVGSIDAPTGESRDHRALRREGGDVTQRCRGDQLAGKGCR